MIEAGDRGQSPHSRDTRHVRDSPLSAAVGVVLFDLREHPVELSAGDVRAAVGARAGHRDGERRAATAAGAGPWRDTALRRAANERPVLRVVAIGTSVAAHVETVARADDVIATAGPQADR